jgi:signal peptidase II
MTHRFKWTAAFSVTFLTIAIDQLTKVWAVKSFKGEPPILFLNDFFRFQYAENRGAFLGMGSQLPETVRVGVMIFLVAIMLGALIKYTWFNEKMNRSGLLGGSFIIAGGFSNWIDRVLNDGSVVDFMNMGIGGLRTGIFNIADMAIMLGMALFLLASFQDEKENKENPSDGEKTDI